MILKRQQELVCLLILSSSATQSESSTVITQPHQQVAAATTINGTPTIVKTGFTNEFIADIYVDDQLKTVKFDTGTDDSFFSCASQYNPNYFFEVYDDGYLYHGTYENTNIKIRSLQSDIYAGALAENLSHERYDGVVGLGRGPKSWFQTIYATSSECKMPIVGLYPAIDGLESEVTLCGYYNEIGAPEPSPLKVTQDGTNTGKWQVVLDQFRCGPHDLLPTIENNNNGYGAYYGGMQYEASVETGCSDISLPPVIFTRVVKDLGAICVDGGCYVDCDASLPTFSFVFGGEDFILEPKSYVDQQQKGYGGKCRISFSQGQSKNVFSLGTTFLKQTAVLFAYPVVGQYNDHFGNKLSKRWWGLRGNAGVSFRSQGFSSLRSRSGGWFGSWSGGFLF